MHAIDGWKNMEMWDAHIIVPKGTCMCSIQIKRKRNNNNANIRYLHWVDNLLSCNLVALNALVVGYMNKPSNIAVVIPTCTQ